MGTAGTKRQWRTYENSELHNEQDTRYVVLAQWRPSVYEAPMDGEV
jgi:hypothetical protein